MERYDSNDAGQTQTGSVMDITEAPVRQAKESRSRGIFRFLKKHIVYAAAAVLVLAGLVVWQIIRTNQETAWKRATDYFSRAEYEKAEKELAGLAMPSKPERLRVYAQTMLATRQLDKSLAAYNKLYETDKDPATKLIIGNVYNEQKKYDEAIKVYRDVIAANGSNVQAYVNLATVYKLQNNTAEAAKVASEGVSKNPANVVLHELKVSMLMNDKSSTEYKEAIDALKKLNPQDQLLQALNEV